MFKSFYVQALGLFCLIINALFLRLELQQLVD